MFSSIQNVSSHLGGYLATGFSAAYSGVGTVVMAPIYVGQAVTNGVYSLVGRVSTHPVTDHVEEAAWIVLNPITDPDCSFEKLRDAAQKGDYEYFSSNLKAFECHLTLQQFDELFSNLPFPIQDTPIRQILMLCDKAVECNQYGYNLDFTLTFTSPPELKRRLLRKERVIEKFLNEILNSLKKNVSENSELLSELLSNLNASTLVERDRQILKSLDSIFENAAKEKQSALLQVIREKGILISAYSFNTQMQRAVSNQDAELVKELLKFPEEFNHKAALQDWLYEAKSKEIKALLKEKIKK